MNETLKITRAEVLEICYQKICADLRDFLGDGTMIPLDDKEENFIFTWDPDKYLSSQNELINVRPSIVKELGYDMNIYIYQEEFYGEYTHLLEACRFLCESLKVTLDCGELDDIYNFIVKNENPKALSLSLSSETAPYLTSKEEMMEYFIMDFDEENWEDKDGI
jgi:hypothetical protein